MSKKEEMLQQYAEEIQNSTKNPSINDTISEVSSEDIGKKIQLINSSITQKAEIQKLRLRDKLTKTVTRVIWFQIIFFSVIILCIVGSVTIEFSRFKKIDNELASLLFEFLKYYIGATVVELLGMLSFILHYVFSTFKNKTKTKPIKADIP